MQASDFSIAFVVLSILTILSGLWYMRLSPQAGADISGTAKAGDPKTVNPDGRPASPVFELAVTKGRA